MGRDSLDRPRIVQEDPTVTLLIEFIKTLSENPFDSSIINYDYFLEKLEELQYRRIG